MDASLPAAALYEKLGFCTAKHEKYVLENDVVLVYEIMEKNLHCPPVKKESFKGRR